MNGHALKGQAKAVLLQAKSTGDTVLNSKAPVATDIVPSLLRYYQLKFKYILDTLWSTRSTAFLLSMTWHMVT